MCAVKFKNYRAGIEILNKQVKERNRKGKNREEPSLTK